MAVYRLNEARLAHYGHDVLGGGSAACPSCPVKGVLSALLKEIITTGGDGQSCDPIIRAASAIVFRNPFAGKVIDDLSPLFDIGGTIVDE